MDVGARRRLDKACAPFSKGTRMCLGMQYVRTSLPSSLSSNLFFFLPTRCFSRVPVYLYRLSSTDQAPFLRGLCSLAWAEMYLAIAQVVQRFDFEFQGVDATSFHMQMQSDPYIIKTKILPS